MSNRMVDLARAGRIAEFEEAWLEAVERPGPVAPFFEALATLTPAVAADQRRALLALLADALEDQERHEDAAATIIALVEAGEATPALRQRLLAHLRVTLAEHHWCEAILDESGLAVGLELTPAVARFKALSALRPGRAVEHRGGWGIGVIREIDARVREMRIEFVDGRRVDLPFGSALDVLEPLPQDDFRSMRYTDPERLSRLAQADPAAVLLALARTVRGGRLSAAAAKKELCGPVVSESAWAGWWKTAKQAAARHAFLAVEGGSRPVIVLRDGPRTPADAARDTLRQARGLIEAVVVARNIVATGPDDETLAAVLDLLASRLEEGPPGSIERLEAELLLAAHGRQHGGVELLRDCARNGDVQQLAEWLEAIRATEGRRLLLATLAAECPEAVGDLLTAVLRRLRSNAADGVIEFLVQRKLGDLHGLLREMMSQPSRAPWTVFHLGRRLTAGRLGDVDSDLVAGTIMAMLQLCETQSQAGERGDRAAKGLSRKIEALFLDRRLRLAARFGECCSRDGMQQALAMVRSSRHVPGGMAEELRVIARERFEDLVESDTQEFWHTDRIFTTRQGLQRKREAFRELTEEKIPANSRAIGVAASHGDLSENAEWEAAMEEQRQLTRKALEMEEELRRWSDLEDQEIPEGVVAPGCRVSYVAGGKSSVMTILGPWDAGDDGVVSYLAPLAGALLGKRAGEHVQVHLPGGAVEIVIQSIERVI